MGDGKNYNTVYMFDFGLAKLYRDPITKEHIPYRDDRDGVGSPRYSTYNAPFNRGMQILK